MKKYTQEEIDALIKIIDNEKVIEDIDFTNCDLSFLDLIKIKFKRVKFNFANLRCADLRSADLRSANLSYANLSYANLSYADLSDANLSYANLSYANLRSADLSDVIGNKLHVKSMQIEKYSISWTKFILQIGCKRFTHQEWKDFSDKQISEMDIGALDRWKKWKDFIFMAIEMSECENVRDDG